MWSQKRETRSDYFPPRLFFKSPQILAAVFSNCSPRASVRFAYVDQSTSRVFTLTRNTVPLPPPKLETGRVEILLDASVRSGIPRDDAGGVSLPLSLSLSLSFTSGLGVSGGGYS